MTGTTFERRNIAHQLADELQRRLTEADVPRRRLPSVREIASLYRVSPNTANAAVRLLAQRNMVRVLPRRGAFIAVSCDEQSHGVA